MVELETTSTVEANHPDVDGEIVLRHKRKFAVGIDLGQSHDYTAICVASKLVTTTLDPMHAPYHKVPPPRFEVSHLERLRLGMPYPQQVDHIEALLGRSPLSRLKPRIFLDQTGVGRPIFDLFAERQALRKAQAVTITGGRAVTSTRDGWSAPKGELVSKLQALLHAGDLRIAASLPDAAVLARELQDFRVQFTDSGNATFNARSGSHDDLLLALALAVFGLSRPEPATNLQVIRMR